MTDAANSRVGTTLILTLIMSLISGCHSTQIRAIDAQGNPSPAVAILKNTSPYSFWGSSILLKGSHGILNMQTRGASIMAGKNTYEILVMRRDVPAMLFLRDAFNVDATCAFKLDAVSGHTYTLGLVDKDIHSSSQEHKVYRASIVIEDSAPGTKSVSYTLPVECASASLLSKGIGFLCRENRDCRPNTPLCVKEAGYENGVCEKQ